MRDALVRVLQNYALVVAYKHGGEAEVRQLLHKLTGKLGRTVSLAETTLQRRLADIKNWTNLQTDTNGATAQTPATVTGTKELQATMMQRLWALTPRQLEHLVAYGFNQQNSYTICSTTYSQDRGIDFIGKRAKNKRNIPVVGQVKQHEKKISAPAVQQLRGTSGHKTELHLVSLSGFSSAAKTEAKHKGLNKVQLMDGKELIELLVAHNIGVAADNNSYTMVEWPKEIYND